MSWAVCWRIAMTDTIGAPAATANVSESWKLIPHSACPAPTSASGAVRAVREDPEVDAGIAVPAVRGRHVEARVVRVGGPVQREPDRPERGVRGGRRGRRGWRRASGDPIGPTATSVPDGVAAGLAGRASPAGSARRGDERDTECRGEQPLHAVVPGWMVMEAPVAHRTCETPSPGFRGRRQRVDGPASFAGISRIRFRGSVALATLSAHEALPGGGVRLSADGTPSGRPGPSGPDGR